MVIRLGLEEVLYAYTIKRLNLGKYYLVAYAKLLKLMMNLPNTNKKSLGAMYCCSMHGVVQKTLCSEILG